MIGRKDNGVSHPEICCCIHFQFIGREECWQRIASDTIDSRSQTKGETIKDSYGTSNESHYATLNVFLVEVVKVWVIQGILGGDAVLWRIGETLFQKIQAMRIQILRHQFGKGRLVPLWEAAVPILELRDARPDIFGGRPQLTKYLEELVDFRVSGKQGALGDHLDKDGPDRPDIHGGSVRLGAQQDLRRPVPEGHHFVCQGANGRTKGTGQAEISQLETTVPGHQQILRFQVAVHDAPRMTKGQTPTALKEVGLDQERGEQSGARFHVLFQILVEEFKYQIQFPFRLNTILEFHNILVRQLS